MINLKIRHLWTWIQWEKEEKNIPLIVVGSDNLGIFPTNYNLNMNGSTTT